MLSHEGKIHRVTFSKSLAEFIQQKATTPLILSRITFRVGQELNESTSTNAGMFAIVDRRKGKVLRICLERDLAHFLCDSSRFVAECWITDTKPLDINQSGVLACT